MSDSTPCFKHRSCYVNFASHLLNSWNANMIFPDAPHAWSAADFERFFDMLRSFGFTCFEFWLIPAMYDPKALECGEKYSRFAGIMRSVISAAHERGLMVKFINGPNCIGREWRFACPNDPDDLELIRKLWRHWNRELAGADIVGVFPGDPGGCNRNGCDHRTYIELALRLMEITLQENPAAETELGTWGTPFSGWGEDLYNCPGWDGSWKMMLDGAAKANPPQCHIWNGKPERAKRAMDELMKRLPEFPENTSVAINLGFSGDADATAGGDAREYVREVAKSRRINSWDYSVTEGELVVHPHWRLPRIFSRRREERACAPYHGAMSYTMSPRLSHMCMYAAAQAGINPDRDPDQVSREFCARVFGKEHEALGDLFEAFEVVPAWGFYPRRRWSKEEAHRAYKRIIEHLESATTDACELPLYPSPEQYRADLLWFARKFAGMSGPNPDRGAIRREYWQRCLSIYDHVPMSVDERANAAADQFANLFA
ncbi:MAG TPA: hypothetical protein PL033_02740 [Candidatus Brocadiia bacterium]|nr:hypothetical protein [Candidatus Brocadiia bacterium]